VETILSGKEAAGHVRGVYPRAVTGIGAVSPRPSRLHAHPEREDSYYATPRVDIVSLIPAGVKRVLEVGCGAGSTGRILGLRGVELLIGVEINPWAASMARRYYDELHTGDVEAVDLSHIPEESLDCVLYPDVLEHLKDPWALLERHVRLLRPEGWVIAGIPNVRYYKAVADLVVRGAWDYREAGVLDLGHLRFFTLKSIEDMFRHAGLDIIRRRTNSRGSTLLRVMNKLVLNRLQPFLVKQYLVAAQKRPV
jgi:2-polyprenyl-3-methyl-5-hydroxy-6-metoxy-1,4-benzoquinol methylase